MSKLRQAARHFARKLWWLPQTLANGLKRRRARIVVNELEVERLDRIRKPWKYLGK